MENASGQLWRCLLKSHCSSKNWMYLHSDGMIKGDVICAGYSNRMTGQRSCQGGEGRRPPRRKCRMLSHPLDPCASSNIAVRLFEAGIDAWSPSPLGGVYHLPGSSFILAVFFLERSHEHCMARWLCREAVEPRASRSQAHPIASGCSCCKLMKAMTAYVKLSLGLVDYMTFIVPTGFL